MAVAAFLSLERRTRTGCSGFEGRGRAGPDAGPLSRAGYGVQTARSRCCCGSGSRVLGRPGSCRASRLCERSISDRNRSDPDPGQARSPAPAEGYGLHGPTVSESKLIISAGRQSPLPHGRGDPSRSDISRLPETSPGGGPQRDEGSRLRDWTARRVDRTAIPDPLREPAGPYGRARTSALRLNRGRPPPDRRNPSRQFTRPGRPGGGTLGHGGPRPHTAIARSTRSVASAGRSRASANIFRNCRSCSVSGSMASRAAA